MINKQTQQHKMAESKTAQQDHSEQDHTKDPVSGMSLQRDMTWRCTSNTVDLLLWWDGAKRPVLPETVKRLLALELSSGLKSVVFGVEIMNSNYVQNVDTGEWVVMDKTFPKYWPQFHTEFPALHVRLFARWRCGAVAVSQEDMRTLLRPPRVFASKPQQDEVITGLGSVDHNIRGTLRMLQSELDVSWALCYDVMGVVPAGTTVPMGAHLPKTIALRLANWQAMLKNGQQHVLLPKQATDGADACDERLELPLTHFARTDVLPAVGSPLSADDTDCMLWFCAQYQELMSGEEDYMQDWLWPGLSAQGGDSFMLQNASSETFSVQVQILEYDGVRTQQQLLGLGPAGWKACTLFSTLWVKDGRCGLKSAACSPSHPEYDLALTRFLNMDVNALWEDNTDYMTRMRPWLTTQYLSMSRLREIKEADGVQRLAWVNAMLRRLHTLPC